MKKKEKERMKRKAEEKMRRRGRKKLMKKRDKKSSKPNQIFPTKVMVVNSNSFVPQKNTKHEIGVIKMGSPSQIRRAVKMEVKIEESEPSSKGKTEPEPVENYQIIKEPTTSYELKKPPAVTENEKKYSITKVPTSTVVLEQITKTYAENVAKYSETKPADSRKRSTSTPRPPPPSYKPPPPPPLCKP